MSDININAQSLPNRCEVCHQADFFDPSTNYCSRCGDSKHQANASDSMPHSKISIYFNLTSKDLSQAEWAIISRKWLTMASLGIMTVLPIYMLVLTIISWSHTTQWSTTLITTLPLVLFVVFIPITRYLNRQKLKSSKLLQETIRCSFAMDGYDISVGKTFSHISWDSLWKVVETSHHFLFYQSGAVYNLIPKGAFNKEDIPSVREIIKKNLDKKAVLLDDQIRFYQQPKFGLGIYASMVTIGLIFVSYYSYNLYRDFKIEHLIKDAYQANRNTNLAEAEQKYRQVIALQPDKISNYEALARCLRSEQKWSEAATTYQTALNLSEKLSPSQRSFILYQLADIATETKDYNAAIKYYQQLMDNSPKSFEVYIQLANVYSLMGQRPQATEQIKKLLEKHPDMAENRAIKDYLDGKVDKIDMDLFYGEDGEDE